MDVDDSLPTKALYVRMPQGETLQMCFMRPDAEDVCPELPFLVAAPEVSLGTIGLGLGQRPPLAADAVLDAMLDEETGGGAAGAAAPPAKQPRRALSDAERSALVGGAEGAAARGEPFGPELSRMHGAEWTAAFGAASPPFAALGAAQLQRLAVGARSEALCDLLLRHSLPRLLQRALPAGAAAGGAAAAAGGAAAAAAGGAQATAAPLPPALAGLLVLLLRRGSSLRLPAADFDEQVVRLLHGAGGALGPRAATQAFAVFCSASEEVRRRE